VVIKNLKIKRQRQVWWFGQRGLWMHLAVQSSSWSTYQHHVISKATIVAFFFSS